MSIPPVATPTARVQFGLAVGEVTPPGDIYHRLWGAAHHERATGVHRPLRASVTALAPLDAPQDVHFLVALDLCLFRPPEMDEIRKGTASLSGVPVERLTFTFSHTHSSGNFSRERSSLPGGERIGPYLDALPATLAGLVRQAAATLAPVTLTAGSGTCPMGHNRDLADVSRGYYVCGFNPVEPPGLPLTVVRVTNDAGEVKGVLVNYPCHPTTLAWANTLLSPDYVGTLRETVEAQTGAPCVFLLAPCGDTGPRHGYVGDTAVADRNGRQVGFSALSILESLPPDHHDFHYQGPVFSGATLGDWRFEPQDAVRRRETATAHFRRIVVPLRYLPDQPTVAQAEEDLAKTAAAEAAAAQQGDAAETARLRALGERHRRLLERIRPLPTGPTYPFEVDVWRTGDFVWLSIEGEPYHALQTELMQRFPRLAFVFSVLANGARPSYLPERHDYGKPLYQVEIALLSPGSLERLIDAIAAEVQSLTA